MVIKRTFKKSGFAKGMKDWKASTLENQVKGFAELALLINEPSDQFIYTLAILINSYYAKNLANDKC